MTMYEEMEAQVPLAFDTIEGQLHVRPTSVGITKKGRGLAFAVSLPIEPTQPKPSRLLGHPVVYWVLSKPKLLHAYG